MGRKRHTAEQIIGKLRTAEIELAKGLGTAEVVRKLGIAEQTYYRWRKEYGGLRLDQAKRLKELEKENTGSRSSWPTRRSTTQSSRKSARENSEPGPETPRSEACLLRARRLRASGLPGDWGSPDRRSGTAWRSVRERPGLWLASSSLPRRTAATATGGSRLSCTERAGV